MSVVTTKLRSPVKPMVESRAILCSTGNRFRVSKTEIAKKKKPQQVTKSPAAAEKQDSSVTSNFSASTDDYYSSSSSSERSSVKTTNSGKITPSKRNGSVTKLNNVVAVAAVVDISPEIPGPVKRCHWITPNSGHFV